MKKSFNVVIATAGRDTLQRMVDSIAPQLEEQDYLTIIWDCQPMPLQIDSNCKVISLHNPEPLGFWGHGSRNRWQDELPGDYFMNADDDDIYVYNAMETVRKHCVDYKLYIFQFLISGVMVPNGNSIEIGNIGTACGVYPKIDKFPKWEYVYGGDGEFYIALSKLLLYEHINKIIYIVKPTREENRTHDECKEIVYCSCGRAGSMSYDDIFKTWRGYCNRCDKRL